MAPEMEEIYKIYNGENPKRKDIIIARIDSTLI